MDKRFDIKPDLIKSAPHLFDSLLILILGVYLIFNENITFIQILGLGLCTLVLVLYIRRINEFHLFNNKLIIKKSLFPFRMAETIYVLNDIKEVKFHKIKGRFGGNFITVRAKNNSCSYFIAISKDLIEKFDLNLKENGVTTIRDGL